MFSDKKRLAIIYFAIVYFIFVGILVYLLAFNTGIMIEEKLSEDGLSKQVFIRNASSKTINNLVVNRIDGNGVAKIAEIKRLARNQVLEITSFIPKGVDKVSLVVEAPFYHAVAKEIVFSKPSTGLSYSIKSPSVVFIGMKFSVSIEVCNTTHVQKNILMEEKHDQGFFSEGSITGSADLAEGKCISKTYSLTPVKDGSTTIYFNVNVNGITDVQKASVKVKE